MRLFVAAILLSIALPASAQEAPIDQGKLYLSSPEACAAAEAGSMAEGDFQKMRLDDRSIQYSEEAWCTIYQLLDSPQQSDLIAAAVCSFGGMKFLDTLLISPVDDRTVSVTSSRSEMQTAIATGEIGGNEADYTTLFTRCALDDFPR